MRKAPKVINGHVVLFCLYHSLWCAFLCRSFQRVSTPLPRQRTDSTGARCVSSWQGIRPGTSLRPRGQREVEGHTSSAVGRQKVNCLMPNLGGSWEGAKRTRSAHSGERHEIQHSTNYALSPFGRVFHPKSLVQSRPKYAIDGKFPPPPRRSATPTGFSGAFPVQGRASPAAAISC